MQQTPTLRIFLRPQITSYIHGQSTATLSMKNAFCNVDIFAHDEDLFSF